MAADRLHADDTPIRDHDPVKLDDLLPWNWSAQQQATAKTA
jgi:hypothetical protein